MMRVLRQRRFPHRLCANHLEHIRDKLDLHNRAQIAAWATEQGLYDGA